MVREDLAAYDAAIEEAYKCMKEGKPLSPKQEKMAAIAGDPKKIDSADLAALRSGKKMDEKKMYEGKKLADKDYDKDGKIESPKDEVWGSRFRAAKAAGKMEEGSAVSGEDPGMEVAKQAGAAQQAQTPKSTPAPTKSKDLSSTFSSARGAAGMNEERKRTASVSDAFMKGQKANQRTLRTDGKSVTYHGNTIAKHEGDEVHVTTAGHSHSPSTRGHINGILSRLGSDKLSVKKGQLHHGKNPVDHDAWIKVKKSTVSEEQMNEEDAKHGMKAAILKRIRAKKMEEEASFNSAQETGKTVNEDMYDSFGDAWQSGVKAIGSAISTKSPKGSFMRNMSRAATQFGRGVDQARDTIGDITGANPTPTKPETAPTSTATDKPVNVPTAKTTSTPSATPSAPTSKTTAAPAAKPLAKPASTPAAPAASAPKAAPLAGKSLQSKIADIAKANKIANVNKIYAGKTMNVGDQKYTIQKGDTLTGIAKKFSGSGQTASSSATKSVPTPPSRPADLNTSTPAKAEPVSPSSSATPTAAPTAMKPNVGRTTVPGNRTGDVTPTAKPSAMAPDVGRTSGSESPTSVTVAPEKSSSSDEKKKAPAPAPTTTMTESFVLVGENKYRIV